MEIKKCQKCGSDNIISVKLDPDCIEEMQEAYTECKDCGFEIRERKVIEIIQNLREKDKEDRRKELWEDAFEEDSLDEKKWSVIKRNKADWGNYMSDNPECIVIQDGMIHLRGIVNPNQSKDPVQYHTGGIETKGKFAFQYGKVEIRVKLESAQGAWPAIWMLADEPRYGQYPKNGEIDLMEHLNDESRIYQTVHSYYTLELKQKNNPGNYATTSINPDDFNIFGLVWDPDWLIFTVNNRVSFVYPRVKNVDPSQWPFDQPFYLMIDQQLGGAWVGDVNPADLPVQLIVDWVRVYKRADY